MIYYVYFDGYGNPRKAISEKDLADKYGKDPKAFLEAVCGRSADVERELASGHVGTLRFDRAEELHEYLGTTGEVVSGFYECEGECRPYNF